MQPSAGAFVPTARGTSLSGADAARRAFRTRLHAADGLFRTLMTDSRPVLDRRASITRHIIMLFGAFAVVTAAVLTLLMLYLRTDAIESGEKVLAGFAELANEQDRK